MRWGWAAMVWVLSACGGASTTPAELDAGAPDAGLADAGSADDCTGIVPAIPASASAFDVGATAGQICTASLTDGSGALAAESHAAGATQVAWHEFDIRGISSGAFNGGVPLAPQAAGFLGMQTSAGSINVALWDASGNIKNLLPFSASSAAVAVAAGFPSGIVLLQNGGSGILVKSFDAGGNAAGSVTVPAASETVLAAAQDQTGPVLAVLSTGEGVWIDLTAGTGSARFALGSATTAAVARALTGSGVAVRMGDRWTAIVHPQNTILLPPPSWMTDGSDFTISRGGKAYAVTTGTNAISLAVGQTTCGSLSMPGVSTVSVGIEGTVIGSSTANACNKVFWSKLLQ